MKVLFVVDMINDFVHPKGALYLGDGVKPVVAAIKTRVRQAVKNGDVIIFLCDVHKEDDPEFKLFPKHAVSETWGSEVLTGIEPKEGSDQSYLIGASKYESDRVYFVGKTKYDAFSGTDLEPLLRGLIRRYGRFDEYEMVGDCTSICVMDTVQGLFNRGYGPIVVYKDSVIDLTHEDHEFALKRMATIYGVNIK